MKVCLKLFFLSSLLFSLINAKCMSEEYEDEVLDDFTDVNFDEHVNAKICSKRSFDQSESSLGASKCCYFELVDCKIPYGNEKYDRNIKACVYLTEAGVKNLDQTIRINSQYCQYYNADCSSAYLDKLLYFIFILIFLL